MTQIEDISHHQKYMERALELASQGEGKVEPNPMVGAVLVDANGQIISEGFHEYFGGPHAEIKVLQQARSLIQGATLYVTLEPCAHYGKTPPCVDRIIQSGIKRVVLAVRDPNPVTGGRGIAALKQSGIEVIEGICAQKARQLNAPFFKLHQSGLPYIITKWAMSLDGKIATYTGDSKWISSAESRKFIYQLRKKIPAIMVGIETVLKDNPELLAQEGSSRHPKRIILDSFLRIPLDSRIIKTIPLAETYIAFSSVAPETKRQQLEKMNCQMIEVEEAGGRLNFIKLAYKLAERGINKIMIEGGGEICASAFESGLVDEVMVFIAPKIIGGKKAYTPVAGQGIEKVSQAIILEKITTEQLGPDLIIRGFVHHSKGNSYYLTT